MLHKIFIQIVVLFTLVSCSINDDENINFTVVTLPIKSYEVPEFFVFGETDTITVAYDLPDGCHSFYELFYQYEGTSRKVAVNAFVNSDSTCTQVIEEKEISFPVQARQREDYIFKFWIGEDSSGENIFEEVIVPVIN